MYKVSIVKLIYNYTIVQLYRLILGSLNIQINSDNLAQNIKCLLEKFKSKKLEIIEREDLGDLKLLKATRDDETISFNKYIKD